MELFNSDFHFSKNLMIITLGKTNQFIRKGKIPHNGTSSSMDIVNGTP